jgi:hypothetical protein
MKPMLRCQFIGLLLLTLAGCQAYDPDVYDARLRAATFDTYHQAIVNRYPDLDRVGLDGAALKARWRKDAVQAKSATEFYHTLARMCSSIQDPHLVLQPNYDLWESEDGPLGASDLTAFRVDGRYVIWSRIYDRLIELNEAAARNANFNGWTIESFNEASPHRNIIQNVLNIGPHGSPLIIELVSPLDGKKQELPRYRGLTVEVKGTNSIKIRDAAAPLIRRARISSMASIKGWAKEASHVESNRGTYLSAWNIDHRGVLRWNGHRTLPKTAKGIKALAADLDAAADLLVDTECTLIDFRFMPGGTTRGFQLVMGRLLPHEVKFVMARKGLFGLINYSHTIEESPSILHGPTVVLVNEFTASYGEWMVGLLRREQDAITVGAHTRGSEFCIVRVKGPDGSLLRFGGSPYERTEGIPAFQFVGLEPDVVVATPPHEILGGSVVDSMIDTHERQSTLAWLLLNDLCPDEDRAQP